VLGIGNIAFRTFETAARPRNNVEGEWPWASSACFQGSTSNWCGNRSIVNARIGDVNA
jgi:hypothetical protein